MFKIKLLVGLAGLMTALVVMAAPAGAEFKSPGKGQGKIIAFPARTVFNTSPGGPTLECKAASGQPWGEYDVQVKTEKGEGFQEETTEGPHLQLKFKKWGHCTVPPNQELKIKCTVQLEQVSSTRALGGVYPPGCEIAVTANCTVKVAAEKANTQLPEASLMNSGSNLNIESKVTGIHSTVSKETGCKEAAKIEASNEGKFETLEGALVAEGLKA